ncbi:MAG: shikimate kinase [Magnetococcales bacterium]|nr:shikimate kinase [Magnetococcales bacterium]MBF0150534.1 shikimate kinase [Magnetococcales bacterium]
MNLILIGMRGAGKSNLSRRLSMLTKRPVMSTDTLISYEHQGRTIPEILAGVGGDWRAFRDLETRVVHKVAAMDEVIIDTGGGVVVDLDEQGREIYSHRKMDVLKKNGRVFWLEGDISRLAAKVTADPRRPPLSATEREEVIMRRRLPFYQEAADHVVNIEGIRREILAFKIRLLADFWPMS